MPRSALIALAMLSWGSVAQAGPRPAAIAGKKPAAALPASSCQVLFGSQAQREDNRRARQKHLYWVDETADSVLIAHSADWQTPRRLRLFGIKLASATTGGYALIQLNRSIARRAGCEPGTYRLGVDYALGQHTRVLAVLNGALLVEQRGALRYLTGDAHRPNWLMAWGSRYEVRVAVQSAPAPGRLSGRRWRRTRIVY